MNGLKNLLEFYINSSVHVALGVVALTVITGLHFRIDADTDILFFVFFGTITGYNFVKYAGIAKLHHRSLAKNLKFIQIFSFLCFLALVFFCLQIGAEVLMVAAVLGFFTLLYALPVFSSRRSLRNTAGLKVYVIAFIWAGVSVLFPLVNESTTFGANVFIEFLQRFLFVLILILPFEIRDLKYDSEELGTIPQRLGVGRTKLLGYVLITGWILLEFLKTTVTLASIAAILCAALLSCIVIYRSNEKQHRFFASFWVEGLPMVWLLLLLLFSHWA